MIERYKSVVDNDIKIADWTDNVHYGLYKNQIDGTLAAAALFCPEIVRVKGYVFIKMFLNNYHSDNELLGFVEELEKQYDYSKKKIEMEVNTGSLEDFFINDNSVINDDLKKTFGETLRYFWQIRLLTLFPEKAFVVELGNELMGEYGECITVYEKEEQTCHAL